MEVLEKVLSEGSTAAKDAVEIYIRPLLAIPAGFRWLRAREMEGRTHVDDMRNAIIEINKRLIELKDWAVSEQVTMSSRSASDLSSFLNIASVRRSPALYLLDNGNVRAVWKGGRDEQIGLQFLGGREVQFVLFSRRNDPEIAVRSCGRDTINGVLDQIQALKLDRLVDGKR
jgi:hypothetical protein